MMLELNMKFYKIRCSKYQYMIKKGSMSNYSFDMLDEDKTGILDFIFERANYPIEEESLKGQILENCVELNKEKVDEYINNLKELEVFEEISTEKHKIKITLITEKKSMDIIEKKLVYFNYSIVNYIDIEEARKDISLCTTNADYIMVFSSTFDPDLFYKINSYVIKYNKKVIISYLDGDEGIIVPIINPNKTGCYNDFEMLRESSFHNLLDYQIMKESTIIGEKNRGYNEFYYEMLINYAVVILNNYCKYSYINCYAYSLDFERMVTSKIRLLKFPKCPSCQGDGSLTHPFI